MTAVEAKVKPAVIPCHCSDVAIGYVCSTFVLGLDRSSSELGYLPTALVPDKVQLELYILFKGNGKLSSVCHIQKLSPGQRWCLWCVYECFVLTSSSTSHQVSVLVVGWANNWSAVPTNI